MQVFVVFFLVISTSMSQTCYGENVNQIFQLEKENGAIENGQPFHQINVTREMQCFFKALQHPRKTCFLQTKHIQSSNIWLCQFFSSMEKEYFKTKHEVNSKVYTTHTQRSLRLPEAPRRDCLEWYNQGFAIDGVYTIRINNIEKDVYCEMTKDNGGWTVIQKRFDGSVSFDRTWQEYKDGFGVSNGEYWLGNEMIHQLTVGTNSDIRISGTRFSGGRKYIKARGFYIEGENNRYKLHSGSELYGDSSIFEDWFHHNGKFFSTRDADYDNDGNRNCALVFSSGWWFNDCFVMNLNGPYSQQENLVNEGKGIIWHNWRGAYSSLKETVMAVKRGNQVDYTKQIDGDRTLK